MSSGGARDGNDEDGARRRMRRKKKGGRDKKVDTARGGGHRSLMLARDLVEAKDPGTGFAHYLLALTLAPELRSSVQAEFHDCARAWTGELEELGRARDAFDCYEQALALYPEDELILNGMGESLFRLGFWDEAAACFLRALRSAPGWAPARENFRRAASWLLERWHFPMLNDRRRNEAYRDALRRAVAKRGDAGCTVLDIGAGTGILSMFARQAGAGRVFACEVSRTAVQLAREVLSANGFADDVSLLHAASHDLAVPRDLPERVSLVVTETMDAALLGEGIVESLIHAWRHLLLPPPPTATVNGADAGVGDAGCGQVIPAGATVYACAVECPEIRRYHRLCVREACGTRLDTGVAFRSLVGLPPRIGRDTPTNNDEDDDDEEAEEGKDADNEGSCREPYTTERMSRVPGGYTFLCDPFPVLAVDFNNPQELEGLFSRAPERRGALVTCGGTLDAIVAWFRLRLDEESSLSTAPGEDSCWEQAVYPATPVRGWNGYTVREGDTLEIEAACRDGHLGLSCVSVTPAASAGPPRRAVARPAPGSTSQLDDASTAAEVATPEGDGEAWLCSAIASLGTAGGCAPGAEMCALEPWEVARLNDVEHWEAFSRAARDAPGRRGGGAGPLRVLDLSAGLSVLPLVVARACRGTDGGGAAIVCSSAEDPRRRRALRALAAANGVAAQLRFLDDGVGSACRKERGGGVRSEPGCGTASGAARPSPDDATEDEAMTMGEQQQQQQEAVVVVESEEDGTEDGSWDVIVLEAVEPTGLLRQGLVEKAALARSLLRPGGTLLPLSATLVGQLLESDALLSDSVVLGSGPTLGLRIAPFLNLFSVPTQVNLDLCTLPGRRLSRPFEVFTLDLMAAGSEAAAEHCVTAIADEPGRVTAVALWVELRLGDGAAALSTLRAHSHVKQAAVALEEALGVSAGSRVEVRAHSHDGDVSLACRVAPAAAATTEALP